MPIDTGTLAYPKNRILEALPADEFKRLVPHLKEIKLKKGDILHRSDTPAESVYFLDKGVASLSVSNAEGVTLELNIVGNEAVVGERAIFRHGYFVVQCRMLTDGHGYKISPQIFQKEFYKGGMLLDLIVNHIEARLAETSLTALCNQTHLIEQRLSRWLLTFADRAHSEVIAMTQENIGSLLIAQRATISVCASILQRKGLISYQRGIIAITDRKGLEKAACECYRAIKETVAVYLSLSRRL